MITIITPLMVYQPIFTLDKMEVIGYEALARGKNGQTPAELYGAARSEGKELELDLACLAQAVQHAPCKANLFLNILPSTLAGITTCPELGKWLINTVPRTAVLEIVEVESVSQEFERVLQAVAWLKKNGYAIAVDDISTGFNRVQLIATIQPEYIKLAGQNNFLKT